MKKQYNSPEVKFLNCSYDAICMDADLTSSGPKEDIPDANTNWGNNWDQLMNF